MPSHRSRREVALLGFAALAGCLGGESSSGDAPDCGGSLPPNEPFPGIEIEPDPVPEEASVRICAEPIEPFTEEHPARIEVELTNEADRTLEFDFLVSPPYPPYRASHESAAATLALVPSYREHLSPADHQFVPDEPDDGCWRATTYPGGEDIPLTETLEPGETISETYDLLAGPDAGCLVAGTYRTEQERYEPVDGAWGFEITLTE